jgi:hypothetical protein
MALRVVVVVENTLPQTPLTVPLVVVEVLQAVLVVLLFLDKDLSEETLAALPLVEVVELVVLKHSWSCRFRCF